MLARLKKFLREPTQYNKDKKTHESKILSEMCNIRAKENNKRFIEILFCNEITYSQYIPSHLLALMTLLGRHFLQKCLLVL